MRRLLSLALIAFTLGCGESTLAPVQTIDGHWTGIENGFSMSLLLTQTDTNVTGIVSLGGSGGFADGTVAGTFKYPAVNLTLNFSQLQQGEVKYVGTMSATEAAISARLTGSGINNLQLGVKKKKD